MYNLHAFNVLLACVLLDYTERYVSPDTRQPLSNPDKLQTVIIFCLHFLYLSSISDMNYFQHVQMCSMQYFYQKPPLIQILINGLLHYIFCSKKKTREGKFGTNAPNISFFLKSFFIDLLRLLCTFLSLIAALEST